MAHQYHHQQSEAQDNNPKFLLDALYCSEEHWEEQDETEDVYGGDSSTSTSSTLINSSPWLPEKDMFWEEEELASLLAKEQQNPLCNFNPGLEDARREGVEWILKVNAHYSFSALTAVLAVNYLHRFLFTFQLQDIRKPWMTHLAAVACLSLAAKVEETQVPLLLDLQVEESKYLFEAKTIKKMEILVLSTLGWKMNPATPLSFIDFFIRRLGLKEQFLCLEFLRGCEGLLLSFIGDSRFMSYLPSVVATATMMQVFNSFEPCLGVEYQSQLLGILGINKGKVDECCKVMLEVWSGNNDKGNKRKFGWIPGSPNGVMDVCFSCDSSSNDSWDLATSVTSSPEPLSKKTRTQDQLSQL